MKKFKILALVLAAMMLFASCSQPTRSRRDRDRNRDRDDDSSPRFTRPAPETSETTAATTTAATTTAATTASDPIPTPATGSGLPDEVFLNAYTDYLEILEENEDEILAYDWQVYEDSSWSSAATPDVDSPCALADVTGDNVPDLIIMKAETEYMATLEMYSYNPATGTTDLVYSEDGFDILAGGGGRYMIATIEEGFTFIYKGEGDEEWTDLYSVYYYNSASGQLECTGTLMFHQDLDAAGMEYVYEYYLDDEEITEADFLFDKQDVLGYVQYILQYNYISDEDMADCISSNPGVAMSYDEMYELLNELIDIFTN